MNDKSELLNQLKIDRTDAEPAKGFSLLFVIIIVLLSVGISGYGAVYFFGEQPEVQTPHKTAKNKPSSAPKAIETAPTKTTPTAPAPAVDTEKEILNASGYITARRMATVSAEVMGLITDVFVEEGMAVETDQVLAQLDSAVANANLQYAKAQVKAAQSEIGSVKVNLAEAKRVLERTKTLQASDFSTEADLTSAEATVESLKAKLISAEAGVVIAQVEAQRQRERLDDHTIKAPFSGVVTVKNAQPGEIVAPSSAGGGFTRTGICTIVDMTSLEIEVDVNEAFIGRVFQGQRVKANLDAYPEWTIPASVIAVIPTADRAKATVKVRIAIETDDPRVLPDMGVKVAFLKA